MIYNRSHTINEVDYGLFATIFNYDCYLKYLFSHYYSNILYNYSSKSTLFFSQYLDIYLKLYSVLTHEMGHIHI